MTAFRDFDQTLATLNAQTGGQYVYYTATTLPNGLEPFAVINEEPAHTALISVDDAKKHHISYEGETFTRIILDIEDALNTPGLTATIGQTLASLSIPCNIVTGYYHAHVFVPTSKAKDAIDMLNDLARQARGWMKSEV
ncbi:MAG: hypothetical protein Q4P66_07245 [Actinomycetaceae bacterium]|nr:hypothetical protein [Actinomycetaceae bacterium]